MPAIIGGSSSTGSSLLVNILNRHSGIYAGPETHLFTKPKLYKDWKKEKESIKTKKGDALKSPGIHRYNGVILEQSETLNTLLSKSNSLSEFANSYFSYFGKNDWVEKTPANSYCFDLFLKEFTDAKVILMVRNPYDAIASMIARGLSVLKSSSIYLANTLANFDLHKAEKFHVVKYEDLITDPTATMKQLCKFLDISFESKMLIGENDMVKMDGWKQNEKGKIEKGSLGRFSVLNDLDQNEIKNAITSIKLNKNAWPFKTVHEQDIRDICALFEYEYLGCEKGSATKKIELWKEELESTIKLYPTNIFNYPISFK